MGNVVYLGAAHISLLVVGYNVLYAIEQKCLPFMGYVYGVCKYEAIDYNA